MIDQKSKLARVCKWVAASSVAMALAATGIAPAQAFTTTPSERATTSSDPATAEKTWKAQESSRKIKPANRRGKNIVFRANDSSIAAPSGNRGDIVIDTDNQNSLGVSLPVNLSLGDPKVESDGSLRYESTADAGADVNVHVYDDASVSIHTVIPNADAPKMYEYELALPGNSSAVPQEDGSILFQDANEEFIGAVAAPWARDANGNSVSTSYEYSDGILRQEVDFDESTAFPVTADPWLGVKIFRRISVDKYRNQPRVNLDLSRWGQNIYYGVAQGGGVAGLAAGQAILRGAGWTEATTWSSTARKALLGKASMKQQFDCHVAGSAFAGQWNLERVRPSRTAHWTYGVAIHHCNWETATRY